VNTCLYLNLKKDMKSRSRIAITGTTSGIGLALVDALSHDNDVTQLSRPDFDLLDDHTLDKIDLRGYDILLNNAGADYNRTDFAQHKYSNWKNTVKINLTVPMYLTQKFITQNTQGTVINVTSTGNHRLTTTNSTVFYRTSKVALKHYTNEVNDTHTKFRIVDIEPGKTQTNFGSNAGCERVTGSNKMKPDDVVQAVKYAIEHPYITHIRIKNTNA
jgi:short-subunit dehydrogenase